MERVPDILAEIVAHKREEVASARSAAPRAELERLAEKAPLARDMVAALTRRPGAAVRVLAEVKRRSPSAGEICADFAAGRIAHEYDAAGADAISVLTDAKYFGGAVEHLAEVRSAVRLPVLRKDFLIDAYQVWQSRAAGADAFLLIADVLEARALAELVALGRRLGMEPLVESHDAEALKRAIDSGATLLGINNRDLRTLRVDLATTERLAPRIPPGRVLVAESGVGTAADVSRLLACGAQAVLVGERLMRAADRRRVMDELKSAR